MCISLGFRNYDCRQRVSFLRKWSSGKAETALETPKYTNFMELQKMLDISFVDLSEDSSDLKVVRAFSPKLVPINFGFDSAHYTHPTLEGKVNPESLEMPHYFA